MRKDSIGLFWQDLPPEKKAKAEKVVRVPPVPVWLDPGYLPELDEAVAFNVRLMSDSELLAKSQERDLLIMDIECYYNYFLIVFMSNSTGKVVFEEMRADGSINVAKVKWIIENFTVITFNGNSYDMPMLALALAGLNCAQLKLASDILIVERAYASLVLKVNKVKKLSTDHIDLIEVSPLRASLKIYGGRLHVPRMQDLPFHPSTMLSSDQMAIIRWYCVNDTVNTAFLLASLREELDLRVALSKEYKTDLRSKSDAQIAEAIIVKEVAKINGDRIKAPEIAPGTIYRYEVPKFVSFETPLMKSALSVIANADLVVSDSGSIKLPPEIKSLRLKIGSGVYRMGIGGLHSSEKKVTLHSTAEYKLKDRDVVSYYPNIILNLLLYPKHLGIAFLRVYRTLVAKRLRAKAEKRKTDAGTLKIVINGTFGKLGSMFSDVYAPDLLIQVTISGQLALLMLIERLELAGIRVVSANTDGVVSYIHVSQETLFQDIVKQWERDTRFETEETDYKSLYIRDVNNYIAVKPNNEVKEKGAFANPWATNSHTEILKKNPTCTICIEAVEAFLINGVPIAKTITQSQDVRKFITIRTADGGAVKDGVYLGKAIRWYYATDSGGEIIYAKNGHLVPDSEGAKPLMQLPKTMPLDVDYAKYEARAYKMLESLGVCYN